MTGHLLRLILVLLALLLAAASYRLLIGADVPVRAPASTPARPLPPAVKLAEVNAEVDAVRAQAQQMLQAAQQRMQGLVSDQQSADLIASELAQTNSLRTALAECYSIHGEWPQDLCGIDGKGLNGTLVQSVQVQAQGVIVARIQRAPGFPPITVVNEPEVNAHSVARWHCRSPDYPDIAHLLVACTFRATGHGAGGTGQGRSGSS